MDRYDDMLLKARSEMMGKNTLRKAPSHDALFSHVWNNLIKFDQQAYMAQQLENQKQKETQQRQQQMQERGQSSPQPADPFGQMNEGRSLDGPIQGMGANFRQGQQETRDPNKKGLWGSIKDKFSRKPAPAAQGAPPGLQPEPAPAEEPPMRSWDDTSASEMSPTYRRWQMQPNTEPGQDFPSRDYIRNRGDQADLEQWDKWNAQRNPPADVEAAQGAPPGLSAPEAGFEEMRETPEADDGMHMYDRMAGDEEPPDDTGGTGQEWSRWLENNSQEWVEPQREETPPPGGPTEIEPMDVWDKAGLGGARDIEEQTVQQENERGGNWWDDIEGAGEMQEEPATELPEPLTEEQQEARWGPADDPATARTQTGTEIPRSVLPKHRKQLPAPKNVAPESRQLPAPGEANEAGNKPQRHQAPEDSKRTFDAELDSINSRSDEKKRKQQPNARSAGGRLEESTRGEKRIADRSVDPTEATEKVLNPPKEKKAAPKKAAKKSPTAFAVANTAKGKEVAEANKKGAAKVEATTSKAKPKAAKPKAAKPKAAKPKAAKKGTAAKLVANTAKGKGQTDAEGKPVGKNIFQQKTQPARKRTKNEKKAAMAPASEAAAQNRSAKRAEAKKNDSPVTDTPNKTYDKYISGSSDSNYVSEVVQAARDGNASAISRLKNDSGDLIDHHGMSEDEINEITG